MKRNSRMQSRDQKNGTHDRRSQHRIQLRQMKILHLNGDVLVIKICNFPSIRLFQKIHGVLYMIPVLIMIRFLGKNAFSARSILSTSIGLAI